MENCLKIFSLCLCPAAMLKELQRITELEHPGQVALEDHFGCGFGACLSCACPLKPDSIKRDPSWEKPALQWSEDKSHAYSLICKDGPVFDLQEIDWEEWLA
jgi:dihydroorotate dehydrogenase electron transfer subunit